MLLILHVISLHLTGRLKSRIFCSAGFHLPFCPCRFSSEWGRAAAGRVADVGGRRSSLETQPVGCGGTWRRRRQWRPWITLALPCQRENPHRGRATGELIYASWNARQPLISVFSFRILQSKLEPPPPPPPPSHIIPEGNSCPPWWECTPPLY